MSSRLLQEDLYKKAGQQLFFISGNVRYGLQRRIEQEDRKMLKVGLIGSGGMGKVHYRSYAQMQGVQVCGVCTEPDKLPDWDVPLYETVEELCRREAPDVIDICTPTYLHPQHVASALAQDVHVICEKPLALSVGDAKPLYELARSKGKKLFVAQVVRYFTAYQALKWLTEEGQYGALLDLHVYRLSARPEWSVGGWLLKEEKSGGIPFDLHLHDLDFLVSLLGAPRKASCDRIRSRSDGAEQLYRFAYIFDGATGPVHVTAEAAWFAGKYPWHAGYRACFEKAVVESEGGDVRVYPQEEKPYVIAPAEIEAPETGINVPPTDGYRLELEDFLDCIREDRPSPVKEEEVLAVLTAIQTGLK